MGACWMCMRSTSGQSCLWHNWEPAGCACQTARSLALSLLLQQLPSNRACVHVCGLQAGQSATSCPKPPPPRTAPCCNEAVCRPLAAQCAGVQCPSFPPPQLQLPGAAAVCQQPASPGTGITSIICVWPGGPDQTDLLEFAALPAADTRGSSSRTSELAAGVWVRHGV